jgi:hypothetical protein
MIRSFRAFAHDTVGIAATEFAVMMPFVVFAFLGEFDMYRYALATQRLEVVAESVAQMVASAGASTSATTTGDGVVADWDINFYENSAFFLYPDILTSPAVQQGTAWQLALEVDLAAIKMTPQGSTYVPKTVWHGTVGNGANNRQCNTTYVIDADSSVPAANALPSDVIGPNSLIVVDVRTTFQPTFGSAFLSPISIIRSVYMTPRNVPFVEYQGTGWMAVNCP